MVNRPKQIGTAGETGVRNYFLSLGYSEYAVQRHVLKGSADEGDIWLQHPRFGLIVIEVKAGKSAQSASMGQTEDWLIEAARERDAAKAEFGFLVQARSGYSPKRASGWWVFMSWADFLCLTMPDWVHLSDWSGAHHIPMRFTLAELGELLADKA